MTRPRETGARALALPPEVGALIDNGGLVAVNHSGGKDSQAMLLHLREAGIPARQMVVVHAPLGRVEWPGTLAHIRATIGDLPLLLARSRTDLFSIVRRRGYWPTPAIRNCTSDLKRGPIARELRRYLKANPRFGGRIVNCLGLRADESRDRAKRPALSYSAANSRAGRHWIDWLPIHDLTERAVFATIAAAGQRPHWVYGAGMRRCSCSFCIMATPEDLRRAAQLRPRLAADYVALEEDIGHTLSPTRRTLRAILGDRPPAPGNHPSTLKPVDRPPSEPYKQNRNEP